MSHPSGKHGSRLKVAVDVTPLAGPRTGVGNLVAGFIDALRAEVGLDLMFYAVTVRGRVEIAAELDARIPPLPARLLRALWLRSDWPAVDLWAGRVDVVHGMNYVVPPSKSGSALVSVHDLTVVRYPEMCTSDTLHYPTLLRRAFARGAHAHVDSAFVGEELLSWSGLSRDRLHVVNPGLRPLDPFRPNERGEPSAPSEGRFPSLAGGRPFILALGTVEPRKGYPTLVRAFAELAVGEPDLLLVFAGGDGWGAVDLGDLTARLPIGIRRRIVRLGYVNEAEKSWLLGQARVLAYPSVYEGFGLPPLEAMQRGTPVVSSNAGSLPEVLGDAAVFVSADDPVGLAEELLRVHSDSDLRSSLVEAGLKRSATYTWRRAGSEMAEVYRTVAGSAEKP